MASKILKLNQGWLKKKNHNYLNALTHEKLATRQIHNNMKKIYDK